MIGSGSVERLKRAVLALVLPLLVLDLVKKPADRPDCPVLPLAELLQGSSMVLRCTQASDRSPLQR
jgi:hypothetical protein